MTAYYCEPKSYPAYPSATNIPANTTTAYDGDGLAKGLATPAVCTIDCTSLTANGTTDQITLCGVAWTPAAASGATLASNLAAQIIGASAPGTSAVNAAATGWTTPQMRNALYASASGATLTIQTWAGSATYNSNTSWKAVGTGGLSAINNTFSGGASGAWGYLFNDEDCSAAGTIWKSAVALRSYGCWFVANNAGPIAGVSSGLSATDVVNVRGNNTVLYGSINGSNSTTSTNPTRAVIFLFDDGTEWSGDPGLFEFVPRLNNGMWQILGAGGSVPNTIAGRSLGCVRVRNGYNGAGSFRIGSAAATGGIIVENFLMWDQVAGTGAGTLQSSFSIAQTNAEVYAYNCKIKCDRNAWVVPFVSSNNGNMKLVVNGLILDFNNFSGTPTHIFPTESMRAGGSGCVILRGIEVICGNPAQVWQDVSGSPSAGSIYVAENCQNCVPNTALATAVGIASGNDFVSSYILQQSVGARHQFRLDTPNVSLEWSAGKDFPTLNAYLPDGTAWSYLWPWSSSATPIHVIGGTEIIRLSKFINTAGNNQITLELAVDPGLTLYTSHLGLSVAYVGDADNKIKVENTRASVTEINGTTALTTSAASWNFGSGAYSTWAARKLVITLSDDIKQNTEIDVSFWAFKPAPSTTSVFINPELGVA